MLRSFRLAFKMVSSVIRLRRREESMQANNVSQFFGAWTRLRSAFPGVILPALSGTLGVIYRDWRLAAVRAKLKLRPS